MGNKASSSPNFSFSDRSWKTKCMENMLFSELVTWIFLKQLLVQALGKNSHGLNPQVQVLHPGNNKVI